MARTGQARAEGGAEQDVADLARALARRVQRRGQAAAQSIVCDIYASKRIYHAGCSQEC